VFILGTSSVLVMWLATTLVFGADWASRDRGRRAR
jgi:hypothetical protein